MKFTLKLPDYIEQYVTNREKDAPYCPICYEKCMSFNRETDISHILGCYKEQLLWERITSIVEETGEVPVIDENILTNIIEEMEDELFRYYDSIK